MQKIIYTKKIKMRKITTIVLLFFCAISFAQGFDKKAERIKALRVAFISNKLDLTSQEAEKFWPLFNKFDAKQIDLHQQKRQLRFKLRPENSSRLSDKENLQLLEEDENIEANMQNNKRLFVKELQGVISPQKIVLLKNLEEEFKNTLLKKFRERRDGPPPRD